MKGIHALTIGVSGQGGACVQQLLYDIVVWIPKGSPMQDIVALIIDKLGTRFVGMGLAPKPDGLPRPASG